MISFRWILYRLLFPLVLGAIPLGLHFLLPQALILPVLSIFLFAPLSALMHLYLPIGERVPFTPGMIARSARRYQISFMLLHGFSCVALMMFEITATISLLPPFHWDMLIRGLLIWYGPYLGMVFGARWCLLKCMERAAADLLHPPLVTTIDLRGQHL